MHNPASMNKVKCLQEPFKNQPELVATSILQDLMRLLVLLGIINSLSMNKVSLSGAEQFGQRLAGTRAEKKPEIHLVLLVINQLANILTTRMLIVVNLATRTEHLHVHT